MKSGEYVTIGEDVVVQVFRESGPQVRISIKAPKEIPIVRGAVLEQAGKKRPGGLHNRAPKKCPSDQIHSARRLEEFAKKQEAKQKDLLGDTNRKVNITDGIDKTEAEYIMMEFEDQEAFDFEIDNKNIKKLLGDDATDEAITSMKTILIFTLLQAQRKFQSHQANCLKV